MFSGTVSVEIVALLGTRTLALSKQTDPLLSFNYVEEVNLTSIEPSMGPADGGLKVTVRGEDLLTQTPLHAFFKQRIDYTDRLQLTYLRPRLPAGHLGWWTHPIQVDFLLFGLATMESLLLSRVLFLNTSHK